MAKVKKAQKGDKVAKYVSPYKSEKTADSTKYFQDKLKDIDRADYNISRGYRPVGKGYRYDDDAQRNVRKEYDKERIKTMNDISRQGVKGKPGFDKNGNPITYKQASASKKRAGGKVMAKKAKPVVKMVKKSAKKK